MLAYMRLIIREAHKHGGMGWLTYDAVFRCNQQGVETPWNILDPSLLTAYIAGQNRQPITPCRHCHEMDHGAKDCALAPIIPATRPPPAGENGIPSPHVQVEQAAGHKPSWPPGKAGVHLLEQGELCLPRCMRL